MSTALLFVPPDERAAALVRYRWWIAGRAVKAACKAIGEVVIPAFREIARSFGVVFEWIKSRFRRLSPAWRRSDGMSARRWRAHKRLLRRGRDAERVARRRLGDPGWAIIHGAVR